MFSQHSYLHLHFLTFEAALSLLVDSQQLWKNIVICHNRQQFPNTENFTKCCSLAPSAATAGCTDGAAPRTIVC